MICLLAATFILFFEAELVYVIVPVRVKSFFFEVKITRFTVDLGMGCCKCSYLQKLKIFGRLYIEF